MADKDIPCSIPPNGLLERLPKEERRIPASSMSSKLSVFVRFDAMVPVNFPNPKGLLCEVQMSVYRAQMPWETFSFSYLPRCQGHPNVVFS